MSDINLASIFEKMHDGDTLPEDSIELFEKVCQNPELAKEMVQTYPAQTREFVCYLESQNRTPTVERFNALYGRSWCHTDFIV